MPDASREPRPLSRFKVFVLVSFLVLLGLSATLVIAEESLRVLEKHPGTFVINPALKRRRDEFRALLSTIPDPRLGSRVPPLAGGHDSNGFRNDSVPARVDVVAIGDSQTWGLNADRADAWPQVLARMSQSSVYNMGIGGYGPIQYLELTEDALHLSPKVIVIGFYLGNDLYDAYSMVYKTPGHEKFRKQGFDKELLVDTIEPTASSLEKEADDFNVDLVGRIRWTARMADHSALLRALARSGLWLNSVEESDFLRLQAWALAHPDHGVVYNEPRMGTVFTPAYRFLAVNLDDSRIDEGLRITEEVLIRIQVRTHKVGVDLIALLIP